MKKRHNVRNKFQKILLPRFTFFHLPLSLCHLSHGKAHKAIDVLNLKSFHFLFVGFFSPLFHIYSLHLVVLNTSFSFIPIFLSCSFPLWHPFHCWDNFIGIFFLSQMIHISTFYCCFYCRYNIEEVKTLYKIAKDISSFFDNKINSSCSHYSTIHACNCFRLLFNFTAVHVWSVLFFFNFIRIQNRNRCFMRFLGFNY